MTTRALFRALSVTAVLTPLLSSSTQQVRAGSTATQISTGAWITPEAASGSTLQAT